MMLTPEQLANLRQAAKGGWKVELDGRGIREIVAHIDAQQARIAELEENAGAHALAMKAGKAMLSAETERADKAEAERDHWKANHDNQVLRARLLVEREDLPLERVKAYQRVQELEANNTSLLYLLAQIREACGDNGKRMQDELVVYIGELTGDAARYRWLRNPNQRIDSVIDKRVGELSSGMGIWEYKAGEELDAAIDAAMQPTWPEDTSDYGSRIAVIGQNGNDGLSYKEQK